MNHIFISDGKENIQLKYKQFEKPIEPAYAVTCHCCQGATLKGEYTIWEWDNLPVNIKNAWRYVAISRTDDKEKIYISNKKVDVKLGRIYKITNTINGLSYYGSTMKNEKVRYIGHIEACKKGGGGKLYKAMRDFGIDKLKCELVKCVIISDVRHLEEIENSYIMMNDTITNGYNSIRSYRNK